MNIRALTLYYTGKPVSPIPKVLIQILGKTHQFTSHITHIPLNHRKIRWSRWASCLALNFLGEFGFGDLFSFNSSFTRDAMEDTTERVDTLV